MTLKIRELVMIFNIFRKIFSSLQFIMLNILMLTCNMYIISVYTTESYLENIHSKMSVFRLSFSSVVLSYIECDLASFKTDAHSYCFLASLFHFIPFHFIISRVIESFYINQTNSFRNNVYSEIHVIIQSKHSCLLDFFLRI